MTFFWEWVLSSKLKAIASAYPGWRLFISYLTFYSITPCLWLTHSDSKALHQPLLILDTFPSPSWTIALFWDCSDALFTACSLLLWWPVVFGFCGIKLPTDPVAGREVEGFLWEVLRDSVLWKQPYPHPQLPLCTMSLAKAKHNCQDLPQGLATASPHKVLSSIDRSCKLASSVPSQKIGHWFLLSTCNINGTDTVEVSSQLKSRGLGLEFALAELQSWLFPCKHWFWVYYLFSTKEVKRKPCTISTDILGLIATILT